jgi:hypothetical protein
MIILQIAAEPEVDLAAYGLEPSALFEQQLVN